MATIRWANKHRAIYSEPKQWVGGVIPDAEDTAAISSAGDAAPTLGTLTPLLMPGTTGSEAYICGSTSLAQETTEYYNEGNGQTLVTSSTPRKDILPESLTIAGGTIDLLGAGSDAALVLQNSTLASASTANIGGAANFYAGHSNLLAGAINIGEPIVINGQIQPRALADMCGLTRKLDINDPGRHLYPGRFPGQQARNEQRRGFGGTDLIDVTDMGCVSGMMPGYKGNTSKGTWTLSNGTDRRDHHDRQSHRIQLEPCQRWS